MNKTNLLTGLIVSAGFLISASANGGPALSTLRLGTGPASGAVSPFNDTTQYASADINPTPGTGQLAWPGDPNSYSGPYWGSIDTYNHIMIADADGGHLIDLAHFGIPMPANGEQGRGEWTDVNRFGSPNITKIVFSSSTQALESNNPKVAATPEASTWAMMILGFLGLGFLGYRKSSRSSSATFRMR